MSVESYVWQIVNEAAERFEGLHLVEKIVSEIEGDSLTLDGAEWWVVEDDLDPGTFTITDDESGEKYRVVLHAEITREVES